jgi:hypothetical protein
MGAPMWSRRQLLSAFGASALAAPWIARSQASPAARNLILVWANGGWDTTFCFDPKLGVSTVEGPEVDETGGDDVESVQTFGDDLRVVINDAKRPSVRTFFEEFGSITAIVNGISTGSVAHDPSRLRVLTGSGAPGLADVTVIAGSVHGAARPLGSVDMSGYSFTGPLGATAGRIGRSGQIRALLDPATSFPAPAGSGLQYPLFVPDPHEHDAVRALVEARAERVRALRGGAPANDKKLDDLVESLLRADRLGDGGAETMQMLKLGVSPSYLASMPIAVDLLKKGVCSSVFIDSASRWDTHSINATQHGLYESLFEGLVELGRQLRAADLFDDTVVLVLSEMTRTPKINAELGKDHWPYTSAMAFGAGVRGGRTYGATNDQLEALAMDFTSGEVTTSGRVLEYDAFAASMLALLDVDPVPWFGDLPIFDAWRA